MAGVRLGLVLLLAGFACNAASAFTTAYSRRWGERRGQLVTGVLRNLLGIPVWVAGLILAVRAPSPSLFARGPATDVLGWLLLLGGSAVQAWALVALRRRAALPSTRDTLVERGPYGWLRHPIYAGLLLDFVAIVLVKPTRASALACALGAAWAMLQARLEEIDLVQRLPPYRAYMGRVPRFVPRSRRRGHGGVRGGGGPAALKGAPPNAPRGRSERR
jgi:protein-S-isoprenylcysteine O-methyltransferase Ste14